MAASLRDHLVVHRGDAVQHALEVHVDAAVPGLCRRGVIGEERERHRPRAVDQNVDGAEGCDRERAQLVGVGPIGDVGAPVGGLPTRRLDLGADGFQPGFVDVGCDDPSAPGGRHLRDEPAESAGRAGDDDDLVLQVIRHRVRVLEGTLTPIG